MLPRVDHDLEDLTGPAVPEGDGVGAAVLAVGRQHRGSGGCQQRPHRFDPSLAHPWQPSGSNHRDGKGETHPTARSVGWCSASIWSAPDRSGLLRLEASPIWSDPDGSPRIVWMIDRMIKPCDAATSATRPRRPLWGRHQIFHLVTAGGLAYGTAAVPSSAQRTNSARFLGHIAVPLDHAAVAAVLPRDSGGW
jgi:hypothetical protein